MGFTLLRKLILIAAAFPVSVATAQTTHELGNEYKACLFANAILYGGQSCHSPSELMPAINASCIDEERRILDNVKSREGAEVADGAIGIIQQRLHGEVVRLIVDGQIKSGCK